MLRSRSPRTGFHCSPRGAYGETDSALIEREGCDQSPRLADISLYPRYPDGLLQALRERTPSQ